LSELLRIYAAHNTILSEILSLSTNLLAGSICVTQQTNQGKEAIVSTRISRLYQAPLRSTRRTEKKQKRQKEN